MLSADKNPVSHFSRLIVINYINNEINGGETDPEDIADDLMCLGDLYMDKEQPEQAIKPYSNAADYYKEEYGDDDLPTIEARLSLAQAYMGANNVAQGSPIITDCISVLEDNLDSDMDDFGFAKQNDDTEAVDFLCDEITEIYDFLGWAYDIKGDQSKSEEYYNKAEAGCE